MMQQQLEMRVRGDASWSVAHPPALRLPLPSRPFASPAPQDYHPPSSQDIPIALNVTLLASSPNKATNAVLGSKATAEPPMVLGSSVFWALRDCIAAVRADRGLSGWFDLSAPASTQAVQLACGITTEMLVV